MFFVSTREEIREAAERAALQDNILEKLSYYRRLIRSCDYGAYPDAYYCRSLKDMGIALRYKAFVMYLLGRVFETFGIKTDVRNPGRSVKVDVFIEAGNDEDLLEDASDDFFEDIVNCPSFFLPDLEALGSVVFCIPIGEENLAEMQDIFARNSFIMRYLKSLETLQHLRPEPHLQRGPGAKILPLRLQ